MLNITKINAKMEKNKIKIDQYVNYTNGLMEEDRLSKYFGIVDYYEGACLAVNGQRKEVEDEALDIDEYIFWDESGMAYKATGELTKTVAFIDGRAQIVNAPKLTPISMLNHPMVDKEELRKRFDDLCAGLMWENREYFIVWDGEDKGFKININGMFKRISASIAGAMIMHEEVNEIIVRACHNYVTYKEKHK